LGREEEHGKNEQRKKTIAGALVDDGNGLAGRGSADEDEEETLRVWGWGAVRLR
jgi:hypothetical protein